MQETYYFLKKFMNGKIALLGSFCLLALGCSTSSIHRAENFKLEDGAKGSTLILSTGSPKNCPPFSSFNIAYSIFREKQQYQSELKYSSVVPIEYIFIDTKTHYKNHYGFLNVISIEPGNYYIAPVVKNRGTAYSLYRYTIEKTKKYSLTVKDNEIVYAGELYIDQPCSIDFEQSLSDNYDRDIDLLKSLNPTFKNKEIVKRIVKPDGIIFLPK